MIQFTQYLRPNGRQKLIHIERPEDIEKMALEIKGEGYIFAIEELMTGDVSMTVEGADVEEEGPLAIKLCKNGPDVPAKIDELVNEAFVKLKGK